MKQKNVVALIAVAAAGVATYFIRKKIADRNRGKHEPAAGPGSRHLTDVFSKAKASANSLADIP